MRPHAANRASLFAECAVLLALIVGFAMWATSPPPRLPIGTANGRYANACCGTVILQNGTMRWGGNSARYDVEYDKNGRHLLLDHEVSIRNGAMTLDAATSRFQILLDTSQPPAALEIADVHSMVVYKFTRVGG